MAHKTMAAAAECERQAAIEEGSPKGEIAIIVAIYYAAISDAEIIVGRKFGEVLFLGVMNKYCCICARAQNKGIPLSTHVCFKNYTGSSSGLEAEIITEGIKKSIEMYNVIYG